MGASGEKVVAPLLSNCGTFLTIRRYTLVRMALGDVDGSSVYSAMVSWVSLGRNSAESKSQSEIRLK